MSELIKPTWDQAPKWAKYLVQDVDGGYWWFEEKPTYHDGFWLPSGPKHMEHRLITDKQAKNSLEERPK